MSRTIKLLVDVGKLKSPNNGLDTFLRAYIANLELLQDEFNIDTQLLLPRSRVENFVTNLPCIKQGKFKNLQAKQLCKKFDVWHSPFHTLNRVPASRASCLQISTVHDFNPVYEKPKRKSKYLRKSLNHLIKTDFITCISNFTLAELRKHHPELEQTPSQVIYNGVNEPCVAKPPKNRPEKTFLFSLGAFMRKKNYESIVRMMPYVEQNTHLVIAGSSSSSYIDELNAIAHELGVSDRVILLPNISSNDKNWYLHHCCAFLFPSKLEGFGLPPAEAMKCGKTPFIFRSTSIPEVVGKAGQYWTDESPEHMANLVNLFMTSDALSSGETIQTSLEQAEKFSWHEMTRSYLELFRKLTDK